jgi:16S rRNA (cytidine1402-2'-O)-methyltransferase
MQPGLYVVATPIGNLGDISLRALETLKQAALIMAEDTRHTRKLLARYDLHVPMLSCHRFNEASRVDQVVDKIRTESAAVALVSNAGMPGLSDPGNRLIRACRSAGVRVEVIPGPSAVSAAAALSGLCEEGFIFIGFLPHKPNARRGALARWATVELPLILFESPYRVDRLLGELEETLGARELFIGRELTKQHEETLWGTVPELRAKLTGRPHKGEWVLVVAPPERRPAAGKIDTP